MKQRATFSILSILLCLMALTDVAQAYYNPSTGRFLSRDPIAERGGANIYAFVKNDAVNNTDLLGMCGLSTLRSVATYMNPFGASVVPLSRTGCVPQVTTATQTVRDNWKTRIKGEAEKKSPST